MSRLCRTLAVLSSISVFGTGLGAVLPIREDATLPRSAIALKLNAGALHTRDSLTGAQLVEDLVRKAQDGWQDARRSTNFKVLPLITSLSTERLAEMVQQAVENDSTYKPVDFSTWYQVQFPQSTEEANFDDIIQLLHTLGKNEEVASCQQLKSHKFPAVKPNDDPKYKDQGYLKPAGAGINAAYAWGFPGGDGAGTTVIDVERGWQLEHEDLVAANITLLAGMNVKDRYGGNWPHGTAVLGEMFMVDNKIGGVGIVPAARGHVVGVQRTVDGGPIENQPEAILEAASFLKFGDVMLLEMQTGDVNGSLWPIEVLDAEFDAIKLATSMGITVIEPAANGDQDGHGVNLDGSVVRVDDPTPRSFLNPKSPDFRDSGAIMVGAGTSTYPRKKTEWSNYGSRVDVHAWGEHIVTSSVDASNNYADTYVEFDGTSGAAPIIAGAALSIQGMLKNNRGKKLSPADMRKLIKIGGTPTVNPAADKIGVQPDLKFLIDGGHLR